MNRPLVFSGLALNLVVAYWPLPVLLVGVILDPISQGKLFVILAEASLALTPASLGLTVAGLLRKRTMALAYRERELLIALGLLAISGTLVSSGLIFDVLLAYSTDCQPLAFWKCYFVQGGTYLGYYFFPAIAVPILTLVWVSRTRLPASSV